MATTYHNIMAITYHNFPITHHNFSITHHIFRINPPHLTINSFSFLIQNKSSIELNNLGDMKFYYNKEHAAIEIDLIKHKKCVSIAPLAMCCNSSCVVHVL